MNHKAREVKRLHRKAMEYADEADILLLESNRDQFLHFTRLALESEAAAADLMVEEDVEPTRSVLHRSAATLALRCEMYDDAKGLIHRGLAGNVPPDIAEELRDLLRQVEAESATRTSANGGADLIATEETTHKTGVLKIAKALEVNECVIITQNAERWTIEVPEDIMNEVLGAFFNKEVQVVGKRMKKERLLRRIRLESRDQIKAL